MRGRYKVIQQMNEMTTFLKVCYTEHYSLTCPLKKSSVAIHHSPERATGAHEMPWPGSYHRHIHQIIQAF